MTLQFSAERTRTLAISIFCIAIAMAWASFRLYDVTVREWLKNKLFK